MQQAIRPKIKKQFNIDDEKVTHTLLVDGNSLFKRSLIDSKGKKEGNSYGAIYQFLNQIRKRLDANTFDYVFCVFDGPYSGYMRYELYNDYKANRGTNYSNYGNTDYDRKIYESTQRLLRAAALKKSKQKRDLTEQEEFIKQIPVLSSLLEELFVRQAMFETVEGDDLIAYYVQHKKPKDYVVIISDDYDITQLISDTVIVYSVRLGDFITRHNSIKILGYTHENVALIKTICGDESDNIKPIKGVGKTTLLKHVPELVDKKMSLDEVIEKVDGLNKARKKPLQAYDNILNHVTEGNYNGDVYVINQRLVDLSKPLLTPEAVEGMNLLMYTPIDPEGRSLENVWRILKKENMVELLDSTHFSTFFNSLNQLAFREKKRFEENNR